MATVAMEVTIGRTSYGIEIVNQPAGRLVRLAKSDGTTYDVSQEAGATSCDCGDFKHRRAGLDHTGCKHIKALASAGLIDAPQPLPVPSDDTDGFGLIDAPPVRPADVQAEQPAPVRPTSLTEKHRPRTLSDVKGQESVILQLRDFLADPVPCAFVFAGGTGTGKTSTALALAAEIGCDLDAPCETGGCRSIASGDQTADNVRDMLRSLALRPMFGNGWKVLIVNEADRMSDAVQHLWLDALELLPTQTLVIFTTNHREKLSRRLADRCEILDFASDAQSLRQAAQHKVNDVWLQETGRKDAPRVETLPGAIVNGEISFRACVQALNPLLRQAKRSAPAERPRTEQPKPAEQEATEQHDWPGLARKYVGKSRCADIARETGIPRQTVYRRLKAINLL